MGRNALLMSTTGVPSMAIITIKVDASQPNTATQANMLKQYVASMRTTFDLGTRIIGTMSNMNDGTIFTQIETYFGLPTGQGQTVFNLVNGSIGAMNGTFQNPNCKQITEQLV
jgi:hypothetical protein